MNSTDEIVPYYIDEIDVMLDKLSSKIPRTSIEIIYLNEIETQKRIYLVFCGMALLMILFVVLL